MNLYLRLLHVLLLLPFLRRHGILEASRLHFRVWPNDCDLNIHMNNGRYLTFMDLGRVHLLAQGGLLGKAIKHRWSPVLAAADVNFIKPLPPFVRFTLITRLLAWDEKYFYIEQRFERRGETVAMAFVKGLFLARGRRLTSAEVVAAVDTAAVSPPMPEALQHWLKMTDLKKKHAETYR